MNAHQALRRLDPLCRADVLRRSHALRKMGAFSRSNAAAPQTPREAPACPHAPASDRVMAA